MKLEDKITPTDLLKYAEAPSSNTIAKRLADALIFCKSENKLYKREVVQVWGYHSANMSSVEPEPDQIRFTDRNMAWFAQKLSSNSKPPTSDDECSAIIHELSARCIEQMPVAVCRVATQIHEDRLITVLSECANAATLDKKGDSMLHALLKLHLPARSLAGISSEPPYEKLNAASYNSVNDLVNKWLDTPIESIDSQLNFKTCCETSLVIAGGLLEEVLDNTPTGVAVNCEVLTRADPSLSVLSGLGGDIVSNTTAVTLPNSIITPPQTRPLTSLVLAWARLYKQSELFVALTDPKSLTPGSLLRQWLT